jgi:hypothetical protein
MESFSFSPLETYDEVGPGFPGTPSFIHIAKQQTRILQSPGLDADGRVQDWHLSQLLIY